MGQRNVLAFVMLLAGLALSAGAQQEIRVTTDTTFVSNAVSGQNSTQSTLTTGGSYLNTVGIISSFTGEKGSFSFNFGSRSTDDPQVDPVLNTITNMQGRMSNKHHALTLGDTFEAFSQYSLSSALKGFAYKFTGDGEGAPEITFTYGWAYPRWDNFNPSAQIRTAKRTAYGVRYAKPCSQYFNVGLSYVRSSDSDPVNVGDPLYATTAQAFDWDYRPLPNVSLRGESAFGRTSVNEGAGDERSRGQAHRVVFEGVADPTRLTFEYERVTPGFETIMGSATSDREKAKLRWRYNQSKGVMFNSAVLWYRNNLSDQYAQTTHHWKPEVSMTVRQLFGRQYASADVGYKIDRVFGGTSGAANHFVTVGYQDRLGKIDSSTNFGFTNYDTNGSVNSHEFSVNTALSTRVTKGNTIYKPSIYLGVWNSRDELVDSTDQIQEMALGFAVDLPKSYLTSNLKIGTNKLLNAAGQDNSSKLFGSLNIYYRPPFIARADGQFYLRALLNDYSYTTASKDFRESGLSMGLNRAF